MAEDILKEILRAADVSLEQAKDGTFFLGFDYSWSNLTKEQADYVQALLK